MSTSFFLIFLGGNMYRSATDSYSNYLLYYSRMNSHEIAVSAASICANWVWKDTSNANISYSNVSLSGGTYNATVTDLVPNRKVVSVYTTYQTALPGYITKPYTGDTTGTIHDTCIVILEPSGYSKYAYFSVAEGGINWISADTLWGPFHTQDKMTINGSPTYYGKVTTNGGTTGSSTARFLGGYQSGVNIPLVTKGVAVLRTAAQNGGRYFYHDSLRLTFKGDSVTWHFGKNKDTTKLISDFTSNGVIVDDSNIIRVSGINHGRVSIASFSGGTHMGQIYLDDNLQYQDDPRVVAHATNITGLVATNEIYITNNTPNNTDIIVQAAIFSYNQGFGAQNYDTRPISGSIFLLGGITQYQRLAVGTINSSTGKVQTGFAKNYKYDTRLYLDAPPFFPTTGLYEIISWYES